MFIFVLFAHWVADFIFQTHWMATNKSKHWGALAIHVLIYTWVMTVIMGFVLLPPGQLTYLFILLTFVSHFLTDAVTSRITSRLFGKYWQAFFVVVGFDQLIHAATLYATLRYLHIPF